MLPDSLISFIRARARIIRFAAVGMLATVIHVSIVMGLVETGLQRNPLIANVIAFCCAVFVSYFGHNLVTFRQRRRSTAQFLRFVTTTLLALGLNQLILYLAVRQLSLDYRIGLALVIALVPAFTYLLARSWVFRAS